MSREFRHVTGASICRHSSSNSLSLRPSSLFFSMATQITQITAQQQAAQQKELARKLEEYIEKLDRVLEKCSGTDSHP